MTETVEKRDMGLKELISRTEESLQIAEGKVYSDNKAIRKRIAELRGRS